MNSAIESNNLKTIQADFGILMDRNIQEKKTKENKL